MTPNASRFTDRSLFLLRLLWGILAVVFTALFFLALPQAVQQAWNEPAVWLDIALQALYLLLGIFIFWQRSNDWVAGVFSLILIMALSGEKLQVVFGYGPVTAQVDLIFAAISSTLLICLFYICLLYTSPSPRDRTRYRMPSSA